MTIKATVKKIRSEGTLEDGLVLNKKKNNILMQNNSRIVTVNVMQLCMTKEQFLSKKSSKLQPNVFKHFIESKLCEGHTEHSSDMLTP